jgi:HSP20 family protein
MAEKQGEIVPVRERRPARGWPSAWGGSPFSAMQRFADEMDRMFADFGVGRSWPAPLWREPGAEMWAPDIDVSQRDSELTIKADLPGLKKDEVSVEVVEGSLTISGERKREREEEREGMYRRERSYGSFRRVIPLPEGAIVEQAKATFRDGVLEITMPAPPAAQARRLEIGEGTKK